MSAGRGTGMAAHHFLFAAACCAALLGASAALADNLVFPGGRLSRDGFVQGDILPAVAILQERARKK